MIVAHNILIEAMLHGAVCVSVEAERAVGAPFVRADAAAVYHLIRGSRDLPVVSGMMRVIA